MAQAPSAAEVTVDVKKLDGQAAGTVALPGELFAASINVPVMHQVVTAQLAAARRGTSKVKTRAEVRGGGRKPWRQKGTGRARQGSSRAPQWTGGGVVHGPSGNQNFTKRVNKKMRQVALRSALSDRAASNDILVVDDLSFDAPRTKDAVAFLAAWGLTDKRVLLVLASQDINIAKSFRNLGERAVHMITVDQINTYDVLCSDVVVFQREALEFVGTGRRADLPSSEEVSA